MVAAIHKVGRVMGLATVGEWVEDDTTRDALAKLGIDFGQGYGLGMPTPPSQTTPVTVKNVSPAKADNTVRSR